MCSVAHGNSLTKVVCGGLANNSLLLPPCTGADVIGDNIGPAMVLRRTIRILREIGRGLVNGVHLTGQLCGAWRRFSDRRRFVKAVEHTDLYPPRGSGGGELFSAL